MDCQHWFKEARPCRECLLKEVVLLKKVVEDQAYEIAKKDLEPERWACCGMVRNEIHGDYCPRCS